MDLALYAPGAGYYARATQRSGRTGDFFTSVDVGPLFGELLAIQFAEMRRLVRTDRPVDLVEAGAGNGRLMRDVLDAWLKADPSGYAALRIHLVERSDAARGQHLHALGPHAPKLASSGDQLPDHIDGIVFANELLDALPTHVVVMTASGLREIYVDVDGDRFVERLAPLSTPAIDRYLTRAGVRLMPGWRAEVNLAAVDWITQAIGRIQRGFLTIVDYGHEAAALYSVAHAAGTLTTFSRHMVNNDLDTAGTPPWLLDPGSCDMTSHVDLTSVRLGAETAGAVTLGVLDQTYFVMALGLAAGLFDSGAADVGQGFSPGGQHRRLAFRTLMQPGGLGSTHKVLLFGKNVGGPPLIGCSYKVRLT
jgi:SAM-dependent MidA family methyltransferase